MRRARKTPLSGNASLSEWCFPLSECHCPPPHRPRRYSRQGLRPAALISYANIPALLHSARPQHWGDCLFAGFQKLEGRRTGSAPNRGRFHLQSRDSGAPASASTHRTRSAGRARLCLANMCFTCERIVLSPRSVTAGTARPLMPSANSTASRLSIPVRSSAAAAAAGSLRLWPAGSATRRAPHQRGPAGTRGHRS